MKTILTLLTAAFSLQLTAVGWKSLDPQSRISGPELTPEMLAGKVVLVDEWGVNCPPCRALLPELQKYYEAFRHKPFIIVGSHLQSASKEEVKAVLAKSKVTYPVYSGFAIAEGRPHNGGAIPFIYVVGRTGRILYSGRDLKSAIEASISAFSGFGFPDSLVSGVSLKKYRSSAKKFVFGKSIRSEMRKLKRDMRQKNSPYAAEASAIMKSIEEAKSRIEEEAGFLIASNPAEAVKVIEKYKTTWPDDGRYDGILAELKEKAKDARKNRTSRKK